MGTGTEQYYERRALEYDRVSDVNDRTLGVARPRRAWPHHVSFRRADAFELEVVPGRFEAAVAGFFWSHVPLDRVEDFLSGLVRRLERFGTDIQVRSLTYYWSATFRTPTDAARSTRHGHPA